MPHLPPRDALPTHDVTNQPDPLRAVPLWSGDPVLQTHADAAGADTAHLAHFAETIGTEDMAEAASMANRNTPELLLFDAGGRRLDEVRFHPGYHQLMQAGIGAGYSAIAWEAGQGGHATHAAMVYMMSQVEPGVCCPMTMTYAAIPALSVHEALFKEWGPKLMSRAYDGAPKPLAQKPGATLGMAMTEKQGGSDVRANTTQATRSRDGYRLRGHKWFCSAPMSDGFLTLAQAPGGLTCFLVPRWLEDERNGIHIQRLKDKLGNRANASAEIEYHDALAYRLGEEGEGVKTIIEMVHHTRLDTALAPAGLMRAALAHAAHWARHRTAFQRKLIDQPLMQSVLADLALDWEGALALGLHVAAAFDRKSEADRAFARLGVALAKYLNNKLCPGFVYEAMEVLGGMGYVEDTPLPLLYREAPLNSIWEGSGNVMALDLMRVFKRAPELYERVLDYIADNLGRRASATHDVLKAAFDLAKSDEGAARIVIEQLAMAAAATELYRIGAGRLADAFTETRLGGTWRMSYGMLDARFD
ncbi:MAG: acyl-CoA dehydrogenase family protein, partial [Pseudomonadota bacterium]